jgi:hypothetical protein
MAPDDSREKDMGEPGKHGGESKKKGDRFKKTKSWYFRRLIGGVNQQNDDKVYKIREH